MKSLIELSFFEELLKTSENSLVRQAVEGGRTAIGYNCSMVPEPLLSVDGIFPVCLRAPEAEDTETANFYLSAFNCSYSRSILQNGIDGEYNFLDGVVFSESCVHIDRVEFTLRDIGLGKDHKKFLSYVIGMPKKDAKATMDVLVEDLRRLGDKLAETYNVDTSDKSVLEAIKKRNRFVTLLKEIGDLRLADRPKITGTEWHTVYAACKTAPEDLLIEPLTKLKAALDKRVPITAKLPRVMVMGSDIDNPAFTALIEAQGCLVVADRYCFGSLPGLETIPEEGDPYRNLAEHYLRTSQCPRMMEKSGDRVDYMLGLIKDYRVDGVIFEVMKFCDLWGWEALKAERAVKEIGIPSVKFEREYRFSSEGQMRTRVQAFIERIRNINVDAELEKQGGTDDEK